MNVPSAVRIFACSKPSNLQPHGKKDTVDGTLRQIAPPLVRGLHASKRPPVTPSTSPFT